MARRNARKKTRRRKQAISLINLIESYSYLTIMTSGLAGTTPWNFIFGAADIGLKPTPGAGVGIDPGLAGRGWQ